MTVIPQKETDRFVENENGGKQGHRRVITIPLSVIRGAAAVAVAIFMVAVMTRYPATTPSARLNNSERLASAQIMSNLMPKEITRGHVTAKDITKVSKAKTKETRLEATQHTTRASERINGSDTQHPEEIITNDYFTVVLASKVSTRNANNFVNLLHEQGVEDVSIYTKKNINRVVCGRFATKDEANRKRRVLCRNDKLSDCWVMRVNTPNDDLTHRK